MSDEMEEKYKTYKKYEERLRQWLTREIDVNDYERLDSIKEKDFVYFRTDETELVGVVLVFNDKKIIIPLNTKVAQLDLIVGIFFDGSLKNALEPFYYDFDFIKSEVEKGKNMYIGVLCNFEDINDFY